MACARYVEMNPVRAGLVDSPEHWPWSSTRAHLAGEDDGLVKARALLDMVSLDWLDFITQSVERSEAEMLKKHERTGRPLGDNNFISNLENTLGRRLIHKKRGRPSKVRGK